MRSGTQDPDLESTVFVTFDPQWTPCQNQVLWAGAMNLQLRILDALAENPGLVFSTQMAAHNDL